MHTDSVKYIVIGDMRKEHKQELFSNVQDVQNLRFQRRKKVKFNKGFLHKF